MAQGVVRGSFSASGGRRAAGVRRVGRARFRAGRRHHSTTDATPTTDDDADAPFLTSALHEFEDSQSTIRVRRRSPRAPKSSACVTRPRPQFAQQRLTRPGHERVVLAASQGASVRRFGGPSDEACRNAATPADCRALVEEVAALETRGDPRLSSSSTRSDAAQANFERRRKNGRVLPQFISAVMRQRSNSRPVLYGTW